MRSNRRATALRQLQRDVQTALHPTRFARGPARTAFRHAGTGALRGCQKQMALEPNGIRSRMHPPHYQKWPITRPLTGTNSMYKHTLHGRSRTGASPRPFRLLGKTHTHTHAVDTDCRENCILLLFEPRPQERGDNSGGVSHRRETNKPAASCQQQAAAGSISNEQAAASSSGQ